MVVGEHGNTERSAQTTGENSPNYTLLFYSQPIKQGEKIPDRMMAPLFGMRKFLPSPLTIRVKTLVGNPVMDGGRDPRLSPP